MPNSQTEFPLTLAEVLFQELEPTWTTIARARKEKPVVWQTFLSTKQKAREWDRICASWVRVRTAIDEIKNLVNNRQEEIDETWERRKALSSKLVPDLYCVSRGLYETCPYLPKKRSALCLSGGGVRSAVFNLGILQGLARARLLDKFDYLSTVSGGGFIGGWLSGWVHRAGGDIKTVAQQLSQQPEDPLNPEPRPVYNLRIYANYLTPRKGLLSPDTWTLVAVYLRNLILTWLVFVPAIMTFLMLPRLWTGIVYALTANAQPSADPCSHVSYLPFGLGLAGLVCGVISLTCIMINLPSVYDKNWRVPKILLSCVFPLVLMAVALSLYWLLVKPYLAFGQSSILENLISGRRADWPIFLIAGALVPGFPQIMVSAKTRATGLMKILLVLLVGAAGAVTGGVTFALLRIDPGLLARLSHLLP